jgi:hypothetical protein
MAAITRATLLLALLASAAAGFINSNRGAGLFCAG